MLVNWPMPHDKRFDMVESRSEMISKYQTQHVPTIDNYSSRKSLFFPKEEQP